MTECTQCQDYLRKRRTTLLPHIGKHVVTTGKKPTTLITNLTDRYHRLGHPTTAPPPLDQATQALRRLAKKRANP